jgi:hypothetical protein
VEKVEKGTGEKYKFLPPIIVSKHFFNKYFMKGIKKALHCTSISCKIEL